MVITVIVQSAENDAQKPSLSSPKMSLLRAFDAIVIQPVDFHVAAAIAQLATKAGIPARLL